ncbi:MAG: hypothetical protein VCC04_07780, partial [Myxococcota bacterium]
MKGGLVISGLRHPWCSGLAAALLVACSGPEERAPDEVAAPPPVVEVAVESPLVSTPQPVGIWVLAEGSKRVLEDTARVEPLLDTAEQLGVSDLFVQVYRGGRSWYPSELADPTPFEQAAHAEG